MNNAAILFTTLFGFLVGLVAGLMLTWEVPEPAPCPVPDRSERVCGYVEREERGYYGTLRPTGCAPYNSEARP